MSVGDSIDIRNILDNEHQTASEIAKLWTEWDTARRKWKERVNETRAYVFATSTKETTNVQNPWSHSSHLPKITHIYENLKSNYISGLFPNDDWLKFHGNDREAVTIGKRRVLESYLRTKHTMSDFFNVVNSLVNDWVLTGNCFSGVTYESETHLDPDTGIMVAGYTGPKVYRISPYDIVFNPLASSFYDSPKIIRSIKTVGDIRREIEENPENQYLENVFDKAINLRNELTHMSVEDIDKDIQLQYDGFGTFGNYIKSGYVELLDFYGDIYDKDEEKLYKNHVITVIDRRWVIRRQSLDTWTGKPHIYHVSWRERPDNLWGMGPLDNLVGLQYRINHLENAKADAFDQMIAPDLIYKGDVQEYPGDNGSIIYEVNENGDVGYLAPDTTVLNADFQIQALEDKMELYAGAPREAMGIRTPGEKTRFEVQALQNAASRTFQNKMNHFEVNMLEKLVNAEIEVARRNLHNSDVIKVIDDEEGIQDFLTVTKDDILANGKFVPVGARHFAKQAQMAQDLMQFQQMMMADPLLAQHFSPKKLGQLWEEILGFQKFNLFEPYARLGEEAEMARLQRSVQDQLAEEDAVAAGPEGQMAAQMQGPVQ